MSWLIIFFGSLFVFTGCTHLEHADRRWWLKQAGDSERPFFDWALNGPQAPSDGFIKPKDFVGWYGVVKSCRMAKIQVPKAGEKDHPLEQAVLTLDHRYADQVNVYQGLGDHASIQTVSLFGDGEFLAITDSCGDQDQAGLWKGDLVRAYGDIRKQDENGRWIVETVRIRSWPRDQYEIAPLRAKIEDHHMVRTAPLSWPKLEFDREVVSSATLADPEIKQFLIARLKKEITRERAARALAEYGGPDAIAALTKYKLVQELKRAKREVGPVWRPTAPDPWWRPENGAQEKGPSGIRSY